MSGVKGSKAKKMQAAASKKSTRTRKGKNQVEKISRTDKRKPKNSGKR
ncbi:MAG: hypothetical protein ACJ790_11870 [Myxococcaceae bacterium]